MNIYFDMDGTIVNLYGVENWLEDLLHEDVRPYKIARPLIKLQPLARCLNKLIAEGHTINIISWTSRGGSLEYETAIKEAKINWLKKHLASVRFEKIIILPYGTPKHYFGDGILFDDEEANREAWGENAFSEKEIFEILRGLY